MRKALFLATVITAAAAVSAFAQGEQKTIRGEVVGVSCFTESQASSNVDAQTSCSLSALKAGEPAGIVDQKTGKLYIAISGDGTNISDKLLPNVSKLVDVTGNVQEKAGVNTITVSEVRPVEGNAPSQAGMPNGTNATNATAGNVSEGLPSGALGSGDERIPQVPWAASGGSNRNDTLYNVTRKPAIHNATTREIPGIPNRGTRIGETYMDEGERGAMNESDSERYR
jgi:hypothetical protein